MKDLQGTASAVVSVPVDGCFALVEAVEAYPSWYGEVVREVMVVEREVGGEAKKVKAKLRVARGPMTRDLDLVLEIERAPPGEIRLTRLPNEPTDEERFAVVWKVRERGDGTSIELELNARLSVPRLVPLGGLGDSLADGFVAAAVRGIEAGRSR